MQTITFYSYKGGVGRSLALSNGASYLAKFGLKVCVIDFDFEAPGIHYKFGIETESIDNGIIDYIHQFIETQEMPASLEPYYHRLEKEGEGDICVIPAGNILKAAYWDKLSSINWSQFLYEEEGEGLLFFLELKERIKKEINPDFLLIDSRTGVTEIGGISTSLLADQVVFLLTNTIESLEGTCQIAKSVYKAQAQNSHEIKPVFVLTRIPAKLEAELEQSIIANLKTKINQKTNQHIKDIYVIHSDRELEIGETLVIQDINANKNRLLQEEYLKLFLRIIPTEITDAKISIFNQNILKDIALDPIGVQKRLEEFAILYPNPQTYHSLLEVYLLARNIDIQDFIHHFEKLHRLYQTFRINKKLSDKYIELFAKMFKSKSGIKIFNIDIVQYYIPSNNIKLLNKIKDIQFEKNINKGLEIYEMILNASKNKTKILTQLLRKIKESNKKHTIKSNIFVKYKEDIFLSLELQYLYIYFLFKIGKTGEIAETMTRNEQEINNYLYKNGWDFWLNISEIVYHSTFNEILEKELNIIIKNRHYRLYSEDYFENRDKIILIGKKFKNNNNFDKFRSMIADVENVDEILSKIL